MKLNRKSINFWSSLPSYFKSYWSWLLIILIGLTLRLYPGMDHYIWYYDQARDRGLIKTIIPDKNLILLGPSTSKFGLFHGPFFYYFATPWYFLGQWNPQWPLLGMILLNLSTLIPLALLAKKIFAEDKKLQPYLVLLSLLLFAISYGQIEYARWLSNVATAIPFLAWTYYLAIQLIKDRRPWLNLAAGLALGLAIQAEIFLLYLIPVLLIYWFWHQVKIRQLMMVGVGLILGLVPFILAELKFNWQSSRLLLASSQQTDPNTVIQAHQVINQYLDHLSRSVMIFIGGISPFMSLILLAVILSGIFVWRSRRPTVITFLLYLLASQAVLFGFPFAEVIYLNLGLGIILVLLLSYFWSLLWQRSKVLAVGSLVLLIGLQLWQLKINVVQNTPFSKYYFSSTGNLMSQLLPVVDKTYQLSQDQPFSIAVLGTPYGARTTWASVYQVYLVRHPGTKPTWFGYYANGYWEDNYFTALDYPQTNHFLIIQPQKEGFLPEPILKDFYQQQDQSTKLIREYNIEGVRLQHRQALSTND